MTMGIRHHVLTAHPYVWPDASNTGVPAGTVLTTNAATVYNTPDIVIENQHFTNKLELIAPCMNPVFRRCLFTAPDTYQLLCDYSANMLVEDCTFTGGAIQAILGQGTFRRLNVNNCRIGISLKDGQSTISRCFIHDLTSIDVDPHFDGIFITGGQNDCMVEHCWIDCRPDGGTSDIFIATRWGPGSPITNTTVYHCRLLGGPSFAMYNQDQDGAITGTRWLYNEVQRGGSGGYFFISSTTTVDRMGNVDAFTGVNIDADGS